MLTSSHTLFSASLFTWAIFHIYLDSNQRQNKKTMNIKYIIRNALIRDLRALNVSDQRYVSQSRFDEKN